jgi:hypothetical protein
MYVICYTDTSTGETHFGRSGNYDDFAVTLPPNMHIDSIFDERANIASRMGIYEQEYLENCEANGLSKHYLHEIFEYNHRQFELVGMNMKNRRYRFIVKDLETKKLMKVSYDYICNSQKIT